MNYEETLDYLYDRTPAFHKMGSRAYKPGLERSIALDDLAGNPHKRYKTIHIAGTNGKGSVAHLLAAVIQGVGHKVGLYTSPHLVDFRERIRVDGRPITKQYVIDYVGKNIKFIEREKPSFFELTSALALDYFRHKKVAYAIIETGMGGRLDSTNIMQPMLSIITSISLDHTQYLGNSLVEIAAEKAGIIKRGVPVIVGELDNDELRQFFISKAFEVSAPITFATETDTIRYAEMQVDGSWIFESANYGVLKGELKGPAQKTNAQIVLSAMRIFSNAGSQIRLAGIRDAFSHVTELTGLMGRWQEVQSAPKIICDIGHNTGAWKTNTSKMLLNEARLHEKLHMVIGISKDKDVDGILALMPPNATYYFTQASGERATPAREVAKTGEKHELKGKIFHNVKDAVSEAMKRASEKDCIFVGGSAFVVGEALSLFPDAIK
ncbi:MAG: bifunctional folylpolyglutamate synthase/dihydrofolate synthase [Tannerella sp.]|jgi:dihydrofolate synthase/folylpolyglutamate synthase|nr:bifunctional folylpolyglutamate synthase/dihydrofolate synthase [Tannerella sp.]